MPLEFNWIKGEELTDNRPGKWIVVGRGHYEVFDSMTDAFIEFAVAATPRQNTDYPTQICLLQHYSPRQWIVHKSDSFWVM